MGQSELNAKLDKGTLNIDPIEAAFGQTGKVRLEPTVRFLPTGSNISLAKGKIIDKAKLTPQACAEALGYALPLLARSSEAEGLVSLDLDDNTIPLSDPERATMKGKLTLHSVAIGPGPVITEIATMLGAKGTKFNMNKEQVVPIKLENGWVHHENLTISAPNFTMRTSGAVSVNGDMNLIADVPLPENEIGQLLRNNPKLREAMANKRLQIPIRGKIGKPQLDPQGFRKEVRRIIDDVARDAAKNALGNLFDKLGPQPKKP
jgi:translocation and assembly module TamB